MILCLGSFWPPSMGNLSSICIYKRKCKRGEGSQGSTGQEGMKQERRQNQPRDLQPLPHFFGREMPTLLWFPWAVDVKCLPGFLQLPRVWKWLRVSLLEPK